METSVIVIIVILIICVTAIIVGYLFSHFRSNKSVVVGGDFTSLLTLLNVDINYLEDEALTNYTGNEPDIEKEDKHALKLLAIREFINTGRIQSLSPLVSMSNLYQELFHLSKFSPTGQMYCRIVTNGFPNIVKVPTFKSHYIVTDGKPSDSSIQNFTIRCRPPKLVPYTEAEKTVLLAPIRNLINRARTQVFRLQSIIRTYKRRHNVPLGPADSLDDINDLVINNCLHHRPLNPELDLINDYIMAETNNLNFDSISRIFDNINANRGNRNPNLTLETFRFIDRFRNFDYFQFENIDTHFHFLLDAILYHKYTRDLEEFWGATLTHRPPVLQTIFESEEVYSPPLVDEEVNYTLDAISIIYEMEFKYRDLRLIIKDERESPGRMELDEDSSVSFTNEFIDGKNVHDYPTMFSKRSNTDDVHTSYHVGSTFHTPDHELATVRKVFSNNVHLIDGELPSSFQSAFHYFFENRQYDNVQTLINEINELERAEGLRHFSHPFDYLIDYGENRKCVTTLKFKPNGEMMWEDVALPYSYLKYINYLKPDKIHYETWNFSAKIENVHYVYSANPRTFSTIDLREMLDVDPECIDEYQQRHS